MEIRRRYCFVIVRIVVIGLTLYSSSSAQQMIANIAKDVETEFGTYRPYSVDIEPSVEPYTVEPNFENVVNFGEFVFSEADQLLLRQNYFVVKPSPYKQLYDVYNECESAGTPAFVTTDAVLHAFHVLYDYILRRLEVRKFVEDLEKLNKALLNEAELVYDEATVAEVKDAARMSVAYLTVANVLMDRTTTIPAYVDSLVHAELLLINNHQGYEHSPIFGYYEDYSQYVPRGHYTRSEILERYFRTLMWYGRMTFALEKQPTLGALLIVTALNSIMIDTQPAFDMWRRIYDPTVFFVGRTDDINMYEYTSLARRIYGDDFFSLPYVSFADSTLLKAFITAADSLPSPQITTLTPKGFRFMGQRFVPDSYILDRLVFYPERLMPFGLDIMAVLGSERACQILDEVYNQMDISNYDKVLGRLKTEYDSLPDSVWAQNLYWNWLYCLMPSLFPKDEGYPPFMQSQAWQDKELCTALGSWAELRHDTILYVKQSVTPIGPPIPVPWPPFRRGYVEPNPHLYRRLAALARFMRIGLEFRGLIFVEFEEKLIRLESLLLFLKMISKKELANQTLTLAEYAFICNFGGIIEDLVTFPPDEGDRFEDNSDDDTAVIADVHTDPNTGICLEEGVGFPFIIYVIVKVENEIKVTCGAMFSYFEFTWPIADRLTDEAWREMQTGPNPMRMPVWTSSFIDSSQAFHNPYPFHSYSNPNGVCVPIKGDVNGDRLLDVQDVMLVVNIILGYIHPAANEFWTADWNEDGYVDILDVVGIIMSILN